MLQQELPVSAIQVRDEWSTPAGQDRLFFQGSYKQHLAPGCLVSAPAAEALFRRARNPASTVRLRNTAPKAAKAR